MKQNLSYLGCLFTIICALLATGCGKKYEKNIVGSWIADTEVQGFEVNEVFTFDKGGTFTKYIIPTEDDGIGYQVEGSWEINALGALQLDYHVNSLKSIPGPTYFKVHDKEDSYLSKVKRQLRQLNEESPKLKLEFGKGNLKITLNDETITYEEIDEDDVEQLIDNLSSKKSNSKSKSSFGSLPSSGSIHQFDYLSGQRLAYSDISGYTSAELRLLRNAIYALHDYDFDSNDLQEYFGNFDGYDPLTKMSI